MIDVNAETPETLDLAIAFLAGHAALKRAMLSGAGMPEMPTPPAPPAPPVPSNVLPFTSPAATPPAPPAPSNLPPVPPIPTSAPIAAIPGTSVAPNPSSVAPASPGASVVPPVDEYDSSGVPFDGRIHQKKKGQKKDGTWKLQKGIADALVSTVMQELAPRIRKTPAAPPAQQNQLVTGEPNPMHAVPAGALAPVSLPPVPPLPGQAQVGLVPPPPPPAEAETVAPQADPFRALVKKVTEARTAKRITAEEVIACAAAAGVPGLQALMAMPHLIGTVEANIDALLATR